LSFGELYFGCLRRESMKRLALSIILAIVLIVSLGGAVSAADTIWDSGSQSAPAGTYKIDFRDGGKVYIWTGEAWQYTGAENDLGTDDAPFVVIYTASSNYTVRSQVFDSNPSGTGHSFDTTGDFYFDLYINPASAITTIDFYVYYTHSSVNTIFGDISDMSDGLTESDLTAYWYSSGDSAWYRFESCEVNISDNYVKVTIDNDTTSPRLTDLTGTNMGGGEATGGESPLPELPTVALVGSGLAILLAAYLVLQRQKKSYSRA